MLGVISSALLERGRASVRCWHNCLASSLPNSFLNGTVMRWESALSGAMDAAEATSVVRIFRFVGVIPVVTRIQQNLTSDNNPASERDLDAGCQTGDDFQQSPIMRLLTNPTLRCPIRTPRFPIVLCHGLYGFDASI